MGGCYVNHLCPVAAACELPFPGFHFARHLSLPSFTHIWVFLVTETKRMHVVAMKTTISAELAFGCERNCFFCWSGLRAAPATQAIVLVAEPIDVAAEISFKRTKLLAYDPKSFNNQHIGLMSCSEQKPKRPFQQLTKMVLATKTNFSNQNLPQKLRMLQVQSPRQVWHNFWYSMSNSVSSSTLLLKSNSLASSTFGSHSLLDANKDAVYHFCSNNWTAHLL